jgi:hypothetical protein
MAHFAKLGANGKVIQVLTLDNSDMLNADGVEDESVGQQYLETHNNWPAQMWIQTSYNTSANQHRNGGTAFRGNYAGIGYEWDEDNNIFWPKKPYASWTKNTSTASWNAPITYPSVTTYDTTWTQADIDNGNAPDGTNAGDARNGVSYDIYWDETAYQADNTKGWEATKETDTADPKTVYDWNGSAWVAQ